MRIVVLSDLYPPYYKGGHELRMKITADGLSERGHDVFVLTSKYGVRKGKGDSRIFRLLQYSQISENKRLLKRYHEIKAALSGRRNYFITKRIIKGLEPDIVYAGEVEQVSLFTLKAIQKYWVPIVHHVGNYYFPQLIESCVLRKSKIKKYYRKTIHGFNGVDGFDFRHIITVSEAVRKKYLEAGFPEDNVSAIHSRGIPSELILQESHLQPFHRNGSIKLLCIGRIVKDKGVHIAIEAIQYLVNHFRMNNALLNIVGDGDKAYIHYLKKLVDDLKIRPYVRFRKWVPHDDILQEYRNHQILLFPSIWAEPFSGVLIEAMSQGLPIVATDSGGTPELIRDRWNGLLVPPNDPIKMAEAVTSLIENPMAAERIARNGIKLILKKYNNEKIIDQIEEYLINVCTKQTNFRL